MLLKQNMPSKSRLLTKKSWKKMLSLSRYLCSGMQCYHRKGEQSCGEWRNRTKQKNGMATQRSNQWQEARAADRQLVTLSYVKGHSSKHLSIIHIRFHHSLVHMYQKWHSSRFRFIRLSEPLFGEAERAHKKLKHTTIDRNQATKTTNLNQSRHTIYIERSDIGCHFGTTGRIRNQVFFGELGVGT